MRRKWLLFWRMEYGTLRDIYFRKNIRNVIYFCPSRNDLNSFYSVQLLIKKKSLSSLFIFIIEPFVWLSGKKFRFLGFRPAQASQRCTWRWPMEHRSKKNEIITFHYKIWILKDQIKAATKMEWSIRSYHLRKTSISVVFPIPWFFLRTFILRSASLYVGN